MFQTVDEKYLIPKKNDYKKLIKYLQDYYTNNIKINESFIRIIHDNSWMFITWIKELNKTNLNNKFLNEIFVNIIATIHNIVHCDIKVANFLLRNSIENFLRFFNIFIKEINIDDSPSYIFETIFSLYDKDNIIHKNFEVVRTIYRDCCLYVHSASLTEDNLCSCLIEYDKFYNKDESTLFLKQFDKAYRIINNLILIYNKKIFDEMKYNSQLIIREYTNQEDLKSIFEYWNNIK